MGFPVAQCKESTCQCNRRGFNPWIGWSPGEGNGNTLQYSCLGHSINREAWWATVCWVARVRHDLVTKQTNNSDVEHLFMSLYEKYLQTNIKILKLVPSAKVLFAMRSNIFTSSGDKDGCIFGGGSIILTHLASHKFWYIFGCGDGLVTKSCLTLATTWTVAHRAPLSMGFSRQEYWNGLPVPSPMLYFNFHSILNTFLISFLKSS